MTQTLLAKVDAHAYQELFIQDLHWLAPDRPPMTIATEDGATFTATNVSSYHGLRVWVCDQKPGSKIEALIDREIAKTSTDRLVIFHDDTSQVWRWPSKRDTGTATTVRLTSHRHRTGSPDPKFEARLVAIQLPTHETLDVNSVVARMRTAFDVEAQNETKHASKLMAGMYTALSQCYPASYAPAARDHEISVTLARILFLIFGDDTEMWRADLFRDFIHLRTKNDGSNLAEELNTLFTHLDTAETERAPDPALDPFPYINGGIFLQPVTLPRVTAEFRDAILEACKVDWSTISPAIFGSMFQSVRDAETRRELGEHYTSEENILKTLNPLFLDELRGEFDRALTMKNEKLALNRLWQKLGQLRYLDPACGCGNFIIVAYRELRDIELRILERLQELTGYQSGDQEVMLAANVLKVSVDNFFGIEIDEWPARIAETAMFLIDRQCDLRLQDRLGFAPNRLPIKEQATIVVGNALLLDWEDVVGPATSDVIIAGNPPFLGISLRSPSQTQDLQLVWGDRYHGTLDYVTGWHAKAISYYGDVPGRWALVSTNSITQGEVVAPLFEAILGSGWRIKFAHRTFRWTSEAAGAAVVHCVIVGFTRDPGITPRLFDYATLAAPPRELTGISNITPYLTDGPTVIVSPSTHPLNDQLGEVAYGNKPTDGGWLIINPDELDDFLADPVAVKYVREYVGARELLHGGDRHCLWLTDVSPADLRLSRLLRERTSGVRAFRLDSKAASTREAASTPHLFRQIAQPSTAYLCIPRHVSEVYPYFLTRRFEPGVICSDATFLAPDADGFIFAIISSSMFITWQRTVGGRIKSDLRFNKLLAWNTFPLPPTEAKTRVSIIAAGEEVITAREQHPGQALADLYELGAMPQDLCNAHKELDRRIDQLFGLTGPNPTELERQDRLFTLYAERVS